ncbi:MAG TPA: SEC-C domain-containing protein [Fusibacter sp.]|nr:SEC-C domain-containing protein [Fusibacter sp.]
MIEKIIYDHFYDLKSQYSRLHLTRNKNREYSVSGILVFSASYNDVIIEDKFEICIDIPMQYPSVPPSVKETGGRIFSSFHVNPEINTLCLGAPLEVKRKFLAEKNLVGFVEKLIIPFLYSYSYYEKNQRVPFGELSHGTRGILDYYKELFQTNNSQAVLNFLKLLISNSYRKNDLCPCRSGKPLEKCHADILIDIIKIHSRHDIIREYEHLNMLIQESRKKFFQNISHAFLQE